MRKEEGKPVIAPDKRILFEVNCHSTLVLSTSHMHKHQENLSCVYITYTTLRNTEAQ